MSCALDIQATYRTILAAARGRRLVSYADIAEAQGKRISQVRDELIGQLGEILCISRRRGWPALTAIIVSRNADGLEGAALEGFAKSAKLAGYKVGDPEEFADEQRRAVFATAPTVPDVLDMDDGAVGEDRGPAIGGGESADSAEQHAAKPSLETAVAVLKTKVEGLQEGAGELREDFREFRAETSNNFNRLEDKIDSNHAEVLKKFDERSEKLFDRRLLVHLAIIGAVVTIIVTAMGMLSP